jgi:hypothetical protein
VDLKTAYEIVNEAYEKTAGIISGLVGANVGIPVGTLGGLAIGRGIANKRFKPNDEIKALHNDISNKFNQGVNYKVKVQKKLDDFDENFDASDFIKYTGGLSKIDNMSMGEFEDAIIDYFNYKNKNTEKTASFATGLGITGIPLTIGSGIYFYKETKKDNTDLERNKKQLKETEEYLNQSKKLYEDLKAGNLSREYMKEQLPLAGYVKDIYNTDNFDRNDAYDVMWEYKNKGKDYTTERTRVFAEKMNNLYKKNDNKKREKQKTASELIDYMCEKTAVTADDILRVEKVRNEAPKLSWREQLKPEAPENFAHGLSVLSTFRPVVSDEDVKYRLKATGIGRKSMILNAHKYYNDIPQFFTKGETQEEYKKRRAENIKESIKYKKLGAKIGNAANIVGVLGGAYLGSKNKDFGKDFGKLYGATSGALIGGLANLGIRNLGKKKTNKEYLKRLRPDELELLKRVKDDDIKEISQDATKAHRLSAQNYIVL